MGGEDDYRKTGGHKKRNRSSRIGYVAAYTQELMRIMEIRNNLKVTEIENGKEVDVTPKYIAVEGVTEKFANLQMKIPVYAISQHDSGISIGSKRSVGSVSARGQSTARMMMGGMRLSMEDILLNIGSARLIVGQEEESSTDEYVDARTVHRLPFIKITLRKTKCLLLYEHRSLISLKGTRDAEEAEFDNQLYDYLTIGKGKIRRQSESEAQTDVVLSKIRETNTNFVSTMDRGTYVSYFEMFDTYEALNFAKITLTPAQTAAKTSRPIANTSEQISAIGKSQKFHAASMIMKRLLAGNEYGEGQRRFRNMNMPHRLDHIVKFHYSVNILFRYIALHELKSRGEKRKAVADLSFCCGNGDILAVAYGIFSYTATSTISSGIVYIWSAKNPGDPERTYLYDVPVTAIEFSPYVPSLLAIGLFNGSTEVRDITNPHDAPLAISQRSTSPGFEPVMAIKWIKETESDDANAIDPFLSLSQDGSVTKFRIINSPYLMGFKQMSLERVEGNPEGLAAKTINEFPLQANRHPQGLNFTMHPIHNDIYYLLTDEGCLHKCSTNYTHQYLEVWKAHIGSVNTMDFSPWSPKLFVTCGNDWYIRVWMEGICKPLITLQNGLNPVHCAYWSRTHSTIIVSLNRHSLDIWDIRRNILQPVTSNPLDSSYNTIAKFARCGRSIAVGNERGNILMCALDDMPFPSHFQYDELEKALFNSIDTFPELKNELKSVGFFGYRKKGFVP